MQEQTVSPTDETLEKTPEKSNEIETNIDDVDGPSVWMSDAQVDIDKI